MIYMNEKKLDDIILTLNNFCVLIDFDQTMTVSDSKGSWGVFENSNAMGSNFIKQSKALVNEYYPYELDYTIDNDTKSKYMEEWYYKNMKLLYNCGLTKSILLNCIKNNPVQLRLGCKDFLRLLDKHNIPVVILSAGIGNVILETLKQQDCLFSNIFILSNFIEFENDKMKPFTSPIIHTSNKSIDKLPIALLKKVKQKDYILLFGDLIEDLYMVKKEILNHTLSFGFLEKNEKDNLDRYLQNFDIVMTNNTSFNNILDILKNNFNINYSYKKV